MRLLTLLGSLGPVRTRYTLTLGVVIALMPTGGCGLLFDDGVDPTDALRDAGGGRVDVGVRDLGTLDAGRPDLGPITCTTSAECDNGNVCDGEEFCDLSTGQCAPGLTVQCDDGIACTDDSVCDPVDGCQPEPKDSRCDANEVCDLTDGCVPQPCGDTRPCRDTNACEVQVQCIAGLCVASPGLVCLDNDADDCLVPECEDSQCVFVPSDLACPGIGCGEGTCGSNGMCEYVPNPALCPTPATSCERATCSESGEGFTCGVRLDDDACEDSIECTTHVCRPGTPGADAASGCALDGLNDFLCSDLTTECVQDICTPTGCNGVVLGPCPTGLICDIGSESCVQPPMACDDCVSPVNPCAPRIGCISDACMITDRDPCAVGGDCTQGYCDLSGFAPQCSVRADPSCGGTAP